MQNLEKISIEFTTYGCSFDDDDDHPLVHVFVKNRRSDTSMAESNTDFLSNYLAWNAVEASPPVDINPYLGAAFDLEGLFPSDDGGLPLKKEFVIPLRTQPILSGEVLLPVVDVHLYSATADSWAFNYTITFQFNDGSLSYSPTEEGIASILIDSNHPNYSGICHEANTRPAPARPPSEPVYLASVTLDFGTHDDDKAPDTQLNVHIVNRLSANSSQDIAVAENIFSDQTFPQPIPQPNTGLKDFPGDRTVVFGEGSLLPLASQEIKLQDIVLPIVYIIVYPTGDDRWVFDYRVTYTFTNGMKFSSTTSNVCLDRDSNKHAGVYNGPSFPTYAPPPSLNTFWTPAVVSRDKKISISFVNDMLDEFVNQRPDPFFKFRFDSIRDFGDQRDSYFELQAIVPNPPGTLSGPGFTEGIAYRSSPTSLGFQSYGFYFNDVNSDSFTIKIDDPGGLLPITACLTFKTPFDMPWDYGTMHVTEFWVRIKFTLALDPHDGKVDFLRWVSDVNSIQWTKLYSYEGESLWKYTGEFLGTPLDGATIDPDGFVDSLVEQALVVRVTAGTFDPGGAFQKKMRRQIFAKLSTQVPITEKTPADGINDTVNAWLLGGVVRGEDRCTVSDVHVDGDTLHIAYTGLTYDPPPPATWPSGDFSPGALANIEHIIVLTKENHSFDSMLGYLSLPVDAGGQGRTDVDGLRGDEFNMLNGTRCPSFAFEPLDTIFSPNPPQDAQRTLWEIDRGKMDAFVEAFADQSGSQVAPRIMGYYNAYNVPQFDALSRDFAICHRWFASHPGPTFPNRFYELTGRLNRTPEGIEVTGNTTSIPELDFASPVMPALTQTIFDYLPSTVTWRYFENGGYCFLRLFADHTFDNTNIVPFDDPRVGFLALARRGELPNVSFIDPHFIDNPPGANCDEPPADVKDGQELVRLIVEAVVSSPQWDKSMLIITYDEHGGFFDHVPPPAAPKVTPESVGTYGVRVPAFVISPWVKPGSVFGHDGPVPPNGPITGDGEVAAEAVAQPSPEPSPGPGGPAAAVDHSAPVAGHASAVGPEAGTTTATAEMAEATAAETVSSVHGGLHFDHTSILKTIARRFMSADPPYLGARFAAAHDLSPILTATPRPSEFRPFIPYTLVYAKTKGALDIPDDSVNPGTALHQNTPDPTSASQQFRVEDAGDGSWYLRTHAGNLYLTVDASMNVTQEPKRASGGAGGNPDAQRWKFTTGITPGAGFTIWNAAFSSKTLQPAGDSANVGVPVVLGDPDSGPGVAAHVKNAWQITSPLLPAQHIVAHP
jgi:Phosphoesterase family/Ricin-type beta-trefoil lectin domain-like